MPTITARHTLTSMWLVLFSAKGRELTEQERSELARLCDVLKQGIPQRTIYNGAVSRYCEWLYASGIFENGQTPEIDDLLEKLDSMKLMVG